MIKRKENITNYRLQLGESLLELRRRVLGDEGSHGSVDGDRLVEAGEHVVENFLKS